MTMRGHARKPARAVVQRAAELEAWRHGVVLDRLFNGDISRLPTKARRAAWSAILAETGCSMNGLATVWGCDRQAIRRARLAEQGRVS